MLPQLTPGDEVVPFTARHSEAEVRAAYRSFGLDREHGVPTPVRLPCLVPLLYEAWHWLAMPPLGLAVGRPGRRRPRPRPLSGRPAPGRAAPGGDRPRRRLRALPRGLPAPGSPLPRAGRGHGGPARRPGHHRHPRLRGRDRRAHIGDRRPVRVVPHGVDHTAAGPVEVARRWSASTCGDAPLRAVGGQPRATQGCRHPGRGLRPAAPGRETDPAPRLVLVGPAGWLDGGQIDEADVDGLGDAAPHARLGRRPGRCGPSTPAPSSSPSRAGTRGSGSRSSRPWCRARRSSARTCRRSGRWPAGRPGWSDPATWTAWSAALDELLGDPRAARRTVRGGPGPGHGAFTWEATVTGTRAVYLEALGG